jgi:hypothetical protein
MKLDRGPGQRLWGDLFVPLDRGVQFLYESKRAVGQRIQIFAYPGKRENGAGTTKSVVLAPLFFRTRIIKIQAC